MEGILLSYSKTLFHDEDGLPMMFCVQPSEDSNNVAQLITAGGGRIVDAVNQKVIFLSSNGLKIQNRSDVICTSFIYACCFSDTLLSKEDFRLISGDNISDNSANSTFESKDHWDKRTDDGLDVFSERRLHDLLVCIIKCEDTWKKIEESKALGDCSWRSIRKNFCFWALQKITERCDHSTHGYNPGPSEKNKEARGHCDLSYPTQSSQSDVNANQCSLNTEKERVKEFKRSVSEMVTDNIICADERVVESSIMDFEGLDENEHKNEEKNYIPVSYKKKVAGNYSAPVIMESDESASEIEKGELEGVLLPLGQRIEKEQSSTEGVNQSIEPKVNQYLNDELRENKRQKSCIKSSKWLGKHVFKMKAAQKSIATSESEVDGISKDGYSSEESEGSTSSEEIKHESKVNRIGKRLRLYTFKEDMILLNWICKKKGRKSDPLTGNRIWKFIEKRNILKDRSWQSMRERFRKRIVPNLKKYPLPKEQLRKLTYELGL